MSEYVFCMRELSLRRNWEWREVTDVDGKLTTGCFATVSMPKAQQLEPRMEFPGVTAIGGARSGDERNSID
eukprot:COSAG02_NODE_34481_length_483_cov_1.401042_2_plen_70_part_01